MTTGSTNDDAVREVAEVSKVEQSTGVVLVSHNEEHSYQGVLVAQRKVRYHLLRGPADYLDFILEADISKWGDVADPALEQKWEGHLSAFQKVCDEIRAGDAIEIIYSRQQRYAHALKRLKDVEWDSWSQLPLVFFPLGWHSFTCEYSHRNDDVAPEVMSIRRLSESRV